MRAWRMEETALSLVETLASAEEKISYLVVMLYGGGSRPTCYGSRHLRGACSRFCTHHQTHGCA